MEHASIARASMKVPIGARSGTQRSTASTRGSSVAASPSIGFVEIRTRQQIFKICRA
jgi:hypothetical protein